MFDVAVAVVAVVMTAFLAPGMFEADKLLWLEDDAL